MNAGTNIKQRTILLVPFQFTDLSVEKKRPALVISNNAFNRSNEDILCCAITSNLKDDKNSVYIENTDMENGFLKFESRIKPYKLFTINKKRVCKILGKLNAEKSIAAVEILNKLIEVKTSA
ncbi:MAG: type II toxin-antitoxin system PemK/MazF family toxin [archaeon]